MKRAIALVLSVSLLLTLCACGAAGGVTAENEPEGVAASAELSDYANGEVLVGYADGSFEVLTYEDDSALAAGLEALASDENVTLIQPNYTYNASGLSTTDALATQQWALSNDGTFTMQDYGNQYPVYDSPFSTPSAPGQWTSPQNMGTSAGGQFGFFRRNSVFTPASEVTAVEGIDINVEEAWEVYDGGSRDVIIALIDTGVDYSHEDLANAIWVNEDEIAGDGIDNDGNGYIDDVYGWNFYNNNNSVYDSGSSSDYAHGTHGAGTIAATSDNSVGIAGIVQSDHVKIMVLKALGGSDGTGTSESVIAAIEYAEANGASICNLSLGGTSDDQALYQAISGSSMLFVVAAGNNGTDTDITAYYPASYDLDNIISVANLSYNGELSSSSNYGVTSVDLAAPGTYIISTAPNNSYSYMTGTSMAAPMVTAAAAMVYSYYEDISLSEVKDILLSSVQALDSLSGKTVSGGMLDLGAAMTYYTLSAGETNEGGGVGESGSSESESYSLTFDSAAWLYNSSAGVYYQTGVVYCSDPYDTTYESMGIFVPAAYMNMTANGDGTYTFVSFTETAVGDYTAATAPIVIPVNTAGYSAQAAPTGFSSGVTTYTGEGIIYLYAGCRGRDTTNGGAPWGVTDLKAAIRCYRANSSVLPGDTDSFFTFGHSGGGAQSAVVGASGDSELYYPYLYAIGAAGVEYDADTNTYSSTISDATCGAMCWCPITSLDYADAAYEWMMGQYASTGTRADGKWTAELSDDLAEAFAEYINSLTLKDEDGSALTLTQSSDGIYLSGTYYEYLLAQIEYSLNDFIDAYTDESGNFSYSASSSGGPGGAASTTYSTVNSYLLSLDENYGTSGAWISYDAEADWYSISSVKDFVLCGSKQASKDVGAFDDLSMSQAENYVFGSGSGAAAHFDSLMASLLAEKYAAYAAADSTVSESDILAYAEAYQEDYDSYTADSLLGYSSQYRQNMYNPMYYLCQDYDGYGDSSPAAYWRINTGITQSDTSLTVEMNLYLSLLEDIDDGTVESVDFAMLWAQGHTTAERAGADSDECFIAWISECLTASAAADEDGDSSSSGSSSSSSGSSSSGSSSSSSGSSSSSSSGSSSSSSSSGGSSSTSASDSADSSSTESASAEDFSDVDASLWYYEYIDYVVENGLMNGTGTETFEPEATATRSMIVTILYRLEGEPAANGTHSFDDVSSDAWYADAVAWAAENGIVEGYSDNEFAPQETVTREQIATILCRYAAYKGMDTAAQEENLLAFSDCESISSYAAAAMSWAVELTLITGTDAATLSPTESATRAQIAAILTRFVETMST